MTELFEEKTKYFGIKDKESLINAALVVAKSKGLSLAGFTRAYWIEEIKKYEKENKVKLL